MGLFSHISPTFWCNPLWLPFFLFFNPALTSKREPSEWRDAFQLKISKWTNDGGLWRTVLPHLQNTGEGVVTKISHCWLKTQEYILLRMFPVVPFCPMLFTGIYFHKIICIWHSEKSILLQGNLQNCRWFPGNGICIITYKWRFAHYILLCWENGLFAYGSPSLEG